jgi:hypothetical protein
MSKQVGNSSFVAFTLLLACATLGSCADQTHSSDRVAGLGTAARRAGNREANTNLTAARGAAGASVVRIAFAEGNISPDVRGCPATPEERNDDWMKNDKNPKKKPAEQPPATLPEARSPDPPPPWAGSTVAAGFQDDSDLDSLSIRSSHR